MPTNFSLSQLYRDALGSDRGTQYDLPSNEDSAGQFVEMQRSLRATDLLGRPLFLPVRLGGLLLDNEPTLRITGRKTIVKTRPIGSRRKGTVKEQIGIDDDLVLIRGIIVNQQNTREYPEDKVKALRDLIGRNEALTIECGLTELFGIYRVVIEEYDFPEIRGFQHAQAYELRCYSDEDFQLEL